MQKFTGIIYRVARNQLEHRPLTIWTSTTRGCSSQPGTWSPCSIPYQSRHQEQRAIPWRQTDFRRSWEVRFWDVSNCRSSSTQPPLAKEIQKPPDDLLLYRSLRRPSSPYDPCWRLWFGASNLSPPHNLDSSGREWFACVPPPQCGRNLQVM